MARTKKPETGLEGGHISLTLRAEAEKARRWILAAANIVKGFVDGNWTIEKVRRACLLRRSDGEGKRGDGVESFFFRLRRWFGVVGGRSVAGVNLWLDVRENP